MTDTFEPASAEGSPPVLPGVIHSRLVKAAQLALSSAQFRPMVQAACMIENLDYSEDILRRAAIDPALLDGLTLVEGSSIDVAILTLVSTVDGADMLDSLIRSAVRGTELEGS